MGLAFWFHGTANDSKGLRVPEALSSESLEPLSGNLEPLYTLYTCMRVLKLKLLKGRFLTFLH